MANLNPAINVEGCSNFAASRKPFSKLRVHYLAEPIMKLLIVFLFLLLVMRCTYCNKNKDFKNIVVHHAVCPALKESVKRDYDEIRNRSKISSPVHETPFRKKARTSKDPDTVCLDFLNFH
jgi:hypothetical protein